jgi:hypothetical protein
MNIENIVNGENFKRICNVIITFDTLNSQRTYHPDKNIVFCKTDLINVALSELSNHSGRNIIITHQSDYCVDYNMFSKKPNSVVQWYAQNVNYNHPDLIPIPIGIENHDGLDKGTLIDIDFLSNLEPTYNTDKITDKIYCNFNVNTHHSRNNVRNILSKSSITHFDQFGITSKEFHNNLSKYLFVASPRGNGIDCHRTWESLIMGSIPIVDKHHMYDTYKNLPIIQVDNWSQVIETDILKEYKNKYLNGELFSNLEELTMEYWINKIIKNYKKI